MLNILCALQCEAQPLISYLGLKQQRGSAPFPVYESETARLAVCGIGKVAAAMATGWLAAAKPEPSLWANIGVAGHIDLPIGQVCLAHSVTDCGTLRRFYPDISAIRGLPTIEVKTLDKPSFEYPQDALIEMEASGFYQAAQRFATVDRIHCLKVVSDNLQHPSEKINKGFVRKLIEQSLPKVENLLEQMRPLLPPISQIDCSPYLEQRRWTETERHQLERLLVRWNAVEGKPPGCQHLGTSREILKFLEHTLNRQPLCFTPSTSKKK